MGHCKEGACTYTGEPQKPANETCRLLYSGNTLSLGVSAYDILKGAKIRNSIISTTLPSLDRDIDGGIKKGGGVYEICGEAGTGKTQMLMSIASERLAEGEAVIYIDCEGSFCFDRFLHHCDGHLQRHRRTNSSPVSFRHIREPLNWPLFVFRVFDFQEFLNIIEMLPMLINTYNGSDSINNSNLNISNGKNITEINETRHQPIQSTGSVDSVEQTEDKQHVRSCVGLIVIDSITCIYNHLCISNLVRRSTLLTDMCVLLNRYSYEYNLGVVVTNYLTTKLLLDDGQSGAHSFSANPALQAFTAAPAVFYGGEVLEGTNNKKGNDEPVPKNILFDKNVVSFLIPALGPTWYNLPTLRIKLSRFANSRSTYQYSTTNENSIIYFAEVNGAHGSFSSLNCHGVQNDGEGKGAMYTISDAGLSEL